jgi:glycosyl transferase family 25
MVLQRRYLNRNFSLLRLLGHAYGTQGYVITRVGAERLMAACRDIRRPIDDQMDRFWEHGVPNLAIFPFPIMEEAVPSAIGMARFEAESPYRTMKRRIYLWSDTLTKRVTVFGIRLSAKLRRYSRMFQKV